MASSCGWGPKGKTNEEVIRGKVTERLEQWKEAWRRSCHEKILDRATTIVDSTILAVARSSRDTSWRLLLKPRPEKPDFEMPLDTLPLEPFLFPDTGRADSLR